MAAGGVPLGTLEAWMGHEKIDTTMIYAHYAPTAREAAQIGAIFDAAVVDDEGVDAAPHQVRFLAGHVSHSSP